MAERCFHCRGGIAELPVDDPVRRCSDYGYAPAFVVEVLPDRLGDAPGACRATVICWSCMNMLRPDAWFSEAGWDAGNPAVRFAALPHYNHDRESRDDPETYVIKVEKPT